MAVALLFPPKRKFVAQMTDYQLVSQVSLAVMVVI
jgi:hypothetical protein